jgi:hypothetical protein
VMDVFGLCYVTFNNNSVIPWWSVLLVEETGVHYTLRILTHLIK